MVLSLLTYFILKNNLLTIITTRINYQLAKNPHPQMQHYQSLGQDSFCITDILTQWVVIFMCRKPIDEWKKCQRKKCQSNWILNTKERTLRHKAPTRYTCTECTEIFRSLGSNVREKLQGYRLPMNELCKSQIFRSKYASRRQQNMRH